MSRTPGSPKTGGRKSGTPNKRTEELKRLFGDLQYELPTKILELIPQLPPTKQVDVYLQLMNYLYPKRKAAESSQPQPQRASGVFLVLPSNGREAPGTKIYTHEEITKMQKSPIRSK